MNGKIKKWLGDKNFGFIETPEKEYFFHISGCVPGFEPREGVEVTFIVWSNERTGREQAQEVQAA